ncbi:MAG: helix-turn-helix domain-containing protein [Firmicutes bacterium]|uniref:Helix-turn-helix domain-containing protein n=1 Tax=Acetobacterium malicum TaxID=52692 RepID=A0ABR6Z1Q2_9FIRM|nr:helix-turn-helix transcriptional regulator [Acetobacterium malicum]MBC3901436.1 helix-turn-helix domain-containing protein [Acetobacterium malicum]MBU4440568.1 helix-turn-helix domain-containing protein [Bacillota bacterium]
MKTIFERLKSYRKALGLSQDYVAKQIGVSRTTITAIECGERNVLANEVDIFSRIYGVTVDEILHETKAEDAEVNMFARAFSTLSVNDKKEIMNLIDFKRKFKESMI